MQKNYWINILLSLCEIINNKKIITFMWSVTYQFVKFI